MNTRIGMLVLTASLAIGLAAAPPVLADDDPAPKPVAPEADRDSVQDVMFLGETRPIFIRLRLDAGGKAFRTAWLDSVKAIHAYLDRDRDGTLTKEEADRGSLPTMVRAATGGAEALPRADLDASPKDGKVSLEELAEVLRPALGPFRVQVGRLAIDRNDALFKHLDRNNDGMISKDELGHAVTSLHRFDLDGDELIDPSELEPFSNPIAAMNEMQTPRGRFAPVPPVIELSSDDPSFRPVRLVLKKYDTGTGEGSAASDNRLSPAEFAIDSKDFASSDTDSDGALDTEELRRYLSRVGARPGAGRQALRGRLGIHDDRGVGLGLQTPAAGSPRPEALRWRPRDRDRRGQPGIPRRWWRAGGRECQGLLCRPVPGRRQGQQQISREVRGEGPRPVRLDVRHDGQGRRRQALHEGG